MRSTATGANFSGLGDVARLRTPLFARARSEVTRTESGAVSNYILVSSLSLPPVYRRFTTRGRHHSSSFLSSRVRSLANVQLSVEERWCVTEGKGSGKAEKDRERSGERERKRERERVTSREVHRLYREIRKDRKRKQEERRKDQNSLFVGRSTAAATS